MPLGRQLLLFISLTIFLTLAVGVYLIKFHSSLPNPADLLVIPLVLLYFQMMRKGHFPLLVRPLHPVYMEYILDGLITVDEHGVITHINRTAAAMLAQTPEQVIGRQVCEVFANWPDVLARLDTREPVNFTIDLPTPPEDRAYRVSIIPIGNGHRAPYLRIISLHDLTDRVQLERALQRRARDAETLLRLSKALAPLLDVTAICEATVSVLYEVGKFAYTAIFLLDPDTGERVLVAGRGLKGDEVLTRIPPGQGLSEFALLDGEVHYTPDVSQSPRYVPGLGGGAEVDVPIRTGHKTYGVLVVESETPHAFDQADIDLIAAAGQQVAVAIERALTHQEVQEAEARYRDLFETVPVGVYRTTPEGRIVAANPALARILGYPDVASLMRVNAYDVYFDPRDRVTWLEDTRGDTYRRHELRLRRADGKTIWVRDVGRVVRDENGQILYFEGYVEDITQEVQARHAREAFLRRVQRQQKAIAELLLHPSIVEGDVETAIPLITEAAAKTLEADRACIYRFHEHTSELEALDSYDRRHGQHTRGVRASLDVSLLPQDVDLTERVVVLEDALNDPRTAPIMHAYGIKEHPVPAVSAAILVRGQVMGLVGVHQVGRPRQWTEDERRFVAELADIAAQVFLNREIRRRMDQLAALNETLVDITSEQDSQRLVNAIVERAVTLMGATTGVLLLRESETEQLRVVSAHDPSLFMVGSTLAFGEGAAGHVAATGQPLNIGDYQAWPDKSHLATGRFHSILSVPIIWHDEVVGVLQVLHEQPDYFSEEDLDILVAFGRQAAIVLHNIQVLEETRRRVAALESLHQASLEVVATLDLSTVLQRVLRRAVDLVGAHDAHIFLYDGGRLHFGAAFWDGKIQDRPYAYPRENGVTYRVARSGEVIIIPNVGEHPLYQEWQWTGALASIPLKVKDQVVGVMNIAFDHPYSFTEEEVRLLELFAQQAAIAVENARLLNQLETHAREQEVLRRVLELLNSASHVQDVFADLSALLKEVSGASRVSLALMNEDNMSFTIVALDAPHSVLSEGARMPISATSAAADILAGRIHCTPDLSQERDAPGERMLYEAGVRSRVNVPVRVGNRIFGALNLTWDRVRGYKEDLLPLLQQVADALALAIERSRLMETTERQTRELQALYRTSLVLGRLVDMDVLLEQAIREILALMPHVDSIGIFEAHAEDDEFEVLLAYEAGQRLHEIEGKRFPFQQGGLTGWVLQSRESLLVSNLQEEAEDLPTRPKHVTDPPILSWLGVPLLVGERLVGAISVQSTRARAFDTSHQRFLELLASQLALALENVRLYQSERTSRERSERLFQAAQALSATLDLQTVFERILTELRSIVPYDSASVQELRGDRLVIIGGHGFPNLDELLGVHFPLDEPAHPNSVVVRERRPLILEDAWNTYEGFRKGPHAAARIRSWLGVPMLYGDEVVGMIALDKQEPGFYTQEHGRLAMAFAAQAAIAIKNARLYAEAQLAAERRTILHQASQEIMLVGPDIEKICQVLHQAATRLLPHYTFIVTLVDWEREEIYAPYLVDGEGRHPPMRFPLGQGLTSLVVLQGKPLHIGDVREDLPRLGVSPVYFGRPDPVRAVLIVPMRAGERIIGTLAVESTQPYAYTDEDREVLELLAATAAGAVETSRLFHQVQEQAQRIQRILDAMPDGVFLLDAEKKVTVANPRAAEYLSLLAPEWQQGPIWTLGHRPIVELLQPAPVGQPHEVRTEGGRIFEVGAAPLGEEETVTGWVLTLRDVTREREVQQRIQQHERLAAVGQLAAGIAHDFNNILQGIVGFASILAKREDIPEDARRRLRLIVKQGERATHLVSQILDFSRMQTSQQQFADLRTLILESVAWLEDLLPSKIQMKVDIPPRAFPALVDPTQIQQVLTNLVTNARDAMPDGGTITIALRSLEVTREVPPPLAEMKPGQWHVLTVSDTGAGIPEDVLPHIFEPFFTTKEVGKGVGLGLAQVYGIIQQHRGHIDVKSHVGEGTTFFIYLPALPVQKDEKEDGKEPKVEHASVHLPDVKAPCVLVISEHTGLLTAMRDMLLHIGYRPVLATTGEQVLHAYRIHGERLRAIFVDVTAGGRTLQIAHGAPHPEGAGPVPIIGLIREGQQPPPGESATVWVTWPCSPEDLRATLMNLARVEKAR